MSRKALCLLFVSLILSGLSALMLWVFTHPKPVLEPTAERLVALRSAMAGEVIDEQWVGLRQIPLTWVQSSSFKAEDFEQIRGKKLLSDLYKGDLLLQAHLSSRDAPFSHQVQAGKRAITIPIDSINSASGLLVPGDLIDLYVSFEYQKKRITAPLLQGVHILATGQQRRYDAQQETQQLYDTVTLEMSPEEATQLLAAQQAGMISTMLRNPLDKQFSNKGVKGNLANILGIQKEMPKVTKPIVLYGESKRIPQVGVSETDHVRGLFELPPNPELVKAWLDSLPKTQEQTP